MIDFVKASGGLSNLRPPRVRRFAAGTRLKILVAVFTGLLFGSDTLAHAQNCFIVNSKDDARDNDPGNGTCDTAPGNGVCTLRAAIDEANALSGADIITLPALLLGDTYALTITGVPEDFNVSGDLDIRDSLTINGAGAASTIIDGGGLDRVFTFHAGVIAVISDLTIQHGAAGDGSGGGILQNAGTLTLNRSTVRDNTAAQGGGIWKIGTVTLNGCTVSGNTFVGNPINPAGGGILNYQGTLTLNNSTVSGNTARFGGGIANANDARALNLNNSTVTGNATFSGNGMGLRVNGGTVTLANTILANGGNPVSGNCDFSGNQPASLISLGHNLSSDVSCVFPALAPQFGSGLNQLGDQKNSNPMLGLLADNGGPTKTHELLPGSPAIDAGNPVGCTDDLGNPLTTDQRCFDPPVGLRCDIGAYEFGATLIDTDNDGIGDACDPDKDGDGIQDAIDT